MKGFFGEHKREVVCFALLIALTVVMCIPITLFPIVRVFGWASYFYLALGYLFAVLHCIKKNVRLRPANSLFLALSLLLIIATLHVVFCDRSQTNTVSQYIVSSYNKPTAGGVLISLITSPLVVYCTPVWAVVILLVLAALFTFLFFRPFIFNVGKEPVVEGRRQENKNDTVISASAPVIKRLREREEPTPKSFNVLEPESMRDKASRLLLGGDYDMSGFSDDSGVSDSYLIRNYDFEGSEEEKRRRAAMLLLREDGSESTADFDKIEKDLGVDKKPIGNLFDDNNDEFGLFSGGAKFRDNTFAAAVRQTETQPDAPSPLSYANSASTTPPFPYSPFSQQQSAPAYAPAPTPPQPASPFTAPPAPSYVAAPVQQPASPFTQPTPTPSYVAPAPVQSVSPYTQPQPEYSAPSAPHTMQAPAPSQPFVEPVAPAPAPEPREFDMTKPYMPAIPTREYVFPPKSVLQPHVNPKFVNYVENWDELKEVIEEKMKNYGVEARLIEATKGPTVTLIAIELGDSCPISKLLSASKDLRRLLKSNNDIAIIPQLPDTCYCGIEIPNKVRGTVSFQEVICSKQYTEAEGDIIIALGRTAAGDILIEDLAKMPHALIAGATGSGKSVCVNVIIASILCRYRPDEVKLILIDLKQVEMGNYSGLPHMLFKEPLSDMHQIVNALKWIRQETENRFTLFKSLHVRNLTEYNKLDGVHRLPRIVIIIDEASELMTKQEVRKTVENTLSSLARVARAAGVHLLFATQNPVKEVITNEIQNNLNTKIAFAVGDFNHSMVIFKAKGAECLLGNGDMYIKRGQKMQRGQCAFISTEETEAIVDYILENNEVSFDEEMIARILNGSYTEDGDTSEFGATERETKETERERRLMPSEDRRPQNPSGLSDAEVSAWQALKICYDSKNVSCSYLQRRMSKGYNAVANILEYWEKEGFVSKQGADKRRFLLRPAEEFYALYREKFGDEGMEGEGTDEPQDSQTDEGENE